MTDVETKLREGFRAFAAETTAMASRPTVASIALRAPTTPERARHSRRGLKLAVAVLAGAAATTGVAAAVGVLPAPVESMLREFRSWGFPADDGASRTATVTDGAYTYEEWVAPLKGGGLCAYDRVIGPNVRGHAGSAACGPDFHRSTTGFNVLRYPSVVGDWTCGSDTGPSNCRALAAGQLPIGATEVIFEFDDGTSYTVASQEDGWFITAFQGIPDGARIVAIRAMDSDGRVIATVES